MPLEHLVYIPLVLLLGITVGYFMGARAVRAELERARKKAKR